jgi:hypothetical protein
MKSKAMPEEKESDVIVFDREKWNMFIISLEDALDHGSEAAMDPKTSLKLLLEEGEIKSNESN